VKIRAQIYDFTV